MRYLCEPQGETRSLTNSAGAVADSYSYTAYGKSVSVSGSDVNPFQYGGKYGYYSEYNGAVLCGHRWYDAHDTLRWLSRDPIGYEGGDNLYAYCGGDPVRGSDAKGCQPGRAGGKPPIVPVPGLKRKHNDPTWSDLLQQMSALDPFSWTSPPKLDQPIYDSLRKHPNYPEYNWENRKTGQVISENEMTNKKLEADLDANEPGPWKKIYQDGKNAMGRKKSLHYFRCPSGKVYDLKMVDGWSNEPK